MTPVLSQRDGFRQPYSNFSNRRYPLAQNRGTILMGIAVWRVTEKNENRDFRSEHCSARAERSERSEHFWTLGTLFGYITDQTGQPYLGPDFSHLHPATRVKALS